MMNDASLLWRRGLTSGLLTTILLTKLFSHESVLDTRCYFKYPARTAAYFFYGVTLACWVNCMSLNENYTFLKNFQLKRRVEENRRTHDLLDTLRYNLDARLAPMFSEFE